MNNTEQSRVEFEKWIKTRKLCTKYGAKLGMSSDLASYNDVRVNSQWITWQKSRSVSLDEVERIKSISEEQSKLIHVGFTDENSIERSTKSSGRFYSDSGGGQNIPLYMLEVHSSRRRHEYFCYVHNLETEIAALRDEVAHYRNQLDLACKDTLTPADAKKIKEANAQFASENFELRDEVGRLKSVLSRTVGLARVERITEFRLQKILDDLGDLCYD